jgi:aryl-alcohol dehydrogenase-like predicted oxidoreductase
LRYRKLGRTALTISEIGFGCGSAGGLMTRDLHEEQLRAVRRALELGITFFDTASAYGNRKSETNLGMVLEETGAKVTLATKARFGPEALPHLREATIASVEESLKLLRRASVDLIQLHNPVALKREWLTFSLTPDDVLGTGGVLEGFKALREQGKVRYFGFTGLGEPQALGALIESGEFYTVQAYYNLLNPTAGHSVPGGFSAVNYGKLIDNAAARDMGVLAIRVLARGALSAGAEVGGSSPQTLSPGSDFPLDVERARRLMWLVNGEIKTLSDAAIRFALMKTEVSTVLVGFSDTEQVDLAVSCSGAAGLPVSAMDHLRELWNSDFKGSG